MDGNKTDSSLLNRGGVEVDVPCDSAGLLDMLPEIVDTVRIKLEVLFDSVLKHGSGLTKQWRIVCAKGVCIDVCSIS